MSAPRLLLRRLRFYRRQPGAWDWTFAAWMVLGPPLAQLVFLGSIDWTYLVIFDSLFLPSLFVGARLDGGSPKPSASTNMKVRGTRTPETGTTEGCSSSSAPGALSAVSLDPTLPARVNSYIAPGGFTLVTGILGVSGAPRERAV